MLEFVDPSEKYITKVLTREYCVVKGGHKLKDLRALRGRRLEDIVMVDNAITSFSGQLDNGIYVPSFLGDPKDCELAKITGFLRKLAEVDDVRPFVRRFAGITQLLRNYEQRRQGVEKRI